MTLYASSCDRPSKSSASVLLPSSVSNSYSFSTGTHGSSRRFCLISSLRCACSPSSFASSFRAACHSSRVPIFCSGISSSFYDYLVRGKTAVPRQTHRSPEAERLGRCRFRPLGKNPVRADEMAGVAVGVLLEVVLMLGLGLPERACRGDFRHDLPGPAPRRLDLGNRLLGDAALILVAVDDRRAVARPAVVALPLERS